MGTGITISDPPFRRKNKTGAPDNTCSRPPTPPPIPSGPDSFREILHDLKTPLNGIVMSLELLKTAGLTGEPDEWLQAASNAADILGDMLRDLEFRDGGDASPPTATDGNLLAFLQALVDVHKPFAWKKGVDLNFIFSQEIHNRFVFCESRWRRIVGNLLTNAVKFTTTGHITLHAFIEDGDAPDAVTFCIKVADSGRGIPEADIPRIYDPFFRGSLSGNGTPPGKGLGLSIVKKLLEEMNAQITVESKLRQGTTFLIRSALKRPGSA